MRRNEKRINESDDLKEKVPWISVYMTQVVT